MTAEIFWFVAACGVLSILYGVYAIRSILAASGARQFDLAGGRSRCRDRKHR